MMEDETYSVISDSTVGSSPLLFSALRRAASGYLGEGNISPVIPSQNLDTAFTHQGTCINGPKEATLPEDPLLPKFSKQAEPNKVLFDSHIDLFESQNSCETIDTQFCQLNLGTAIPLFKNEPTNVDITIPFENPQNRSTTELSIAVCNEKNRKLSHCVRGDEDSRSISSCSTLPPAAASSLPCIWNTGDTQTQLSSSVVESADVNSLTHRKSLPLSSHILHSSALEKESSSVQCVIASKEMGESFTRDAHEITYLSNINQDIHASFIPSKKNSGSFLATPGTDKLKNITTCSNDNDSCDKNILNSTITASTKISVFEKCNENKRNYSLQSQPNSISIDKFKTKTKSFQVHKTEVETLCRLINLYDATIEKIKQKKPTAAHLDKLQHITDKLVRSQDEERRKLYSWAQNLSCEGSVNLKYERKKKQLEERQTLLLTAQNKHSYLLQSLTSLNDKIEPPQKFVNKESLSADNNNFQNSATIHTTTSDSSLCIGQLMVKNILSIQSSPVEESNGTLKQKTTQSSEELESIHQNLGTSDKKYSITGQHDQSQTVAPSICPVPTSVSGRVIDSIQKNSLASSKTNHLSEILSDHCYHNNNLQRESSNPCLMNDSSQMVDTEYLQSCFEKFSDSKKVSAKCNKVFQPQFPVSSKQLSNCDSIPHDSQSTQNPSSETDACTFKHCVGKNVEVQTEFDGRIVGGCNDLKTIDGFCNKPSVEVNCIESNKQIFNHGIKEHGAVNVYRTDQSTTKHQSNLNSTDLYLDVRDHKNNSTECPKSKTTACSYSGIVSPARIVTNNPVSPCSTTSSSFFPVSSQEIIRRMEIRSAGHLYGHPVPSVAAASHEINNNSNDTLSLTPKQHQVNVTKFTDARTSVNEHTKTEVIAVFKDSLRPQNSTHPPDTATSRCTQLMPAMSHYINQSDVQKVNTKSGDVTCPNQVNTTKKTPLNDKCFRKRGRPKKQETGCGVDCYSQKKRKNNSQNMISNYFPVIVEHTASKPADSVAPLCQPAVNVSSHCKLAPLCEPVVTVSTPIVTVNTPGKPAQLCKPVITAESSFSVLTLSGGKRMSGLPTFTASADHTVTKPLVSSIETIELISDAEVSYSSLDFPENFWQENFSTITMSQRFWDSLDLW